jgi:hypothetical protein
MSNPFLQNGESTHEYKNQMFVVDFYPHPLGNTWQCSDSSHYIRARANTKQEAIDQAHKEWDEYKPTETMTNNKQQTAVKIYTEEQVKEMFEQFQMHLPFHYEILLQEHMNKLTPIKLPSDEEIKKVLIQYNDYLFTFIDKDEIGINVETEDVIKWYNENYGEDDSLKINNGGHQI